MLRRLVREPLLVFAVCGAALFGLHAHLAGRGDAVVVLSTATRAALVEDFEQLTGRTASAADIAAIERDWIADELLLRDALDAGLHLADVDIRGELIRTQRLQVAGVLPDPSDEQLVDYYAEHLARYHGEPTISFEHVYLQAPPDDAAATLARLQGGEKVAGDPYWQGSQFPHYGQSILRGMFGQPLVDALWAAPLDQWSGPLQSPRGWHYVRPTERLPATLLAFADVRDQVERDYLASEIERAVDRRVAELRERYPVTIER